MNDLFRTFIKTLSQGAMVGNVVIKSLPNHIDSLSKVTFGFSPSRTLAKYGENHAALLDCVKARLHPSGKIRLQGLWPKFCRTILSAARFLSQFERPAQFYKWIDQFNGKSRDASLLIACPLILSEEIFGAGFALSCNLLIDLGYKDYAKPDRHVNRLMKGLGFVNEDANDYQCLKELVRIAKEAGAPPFAVDKALFLIGSGRYYNHAEVKVAEKRKRAGNYLTDMQSI